MSTASSLLKSAGRAAADVVRSPAQRRAHALASRPPARLVDLDGLEAELEVADRLFAVSDERARAHLLGLRLALPTDAPPDPFSDAYREWTWQVYRRISGRDRYEVANERSPFQMEVALRRPFPFSSGSASVAGAELMTRGFALRCLAAAPPARVLELGPGWGNLTTDLARLGYRVTAVEVDPDFCSLIGARATAGTSLEVVQADMLEYVGGATPSEPFAAAVCYESFHHCSDHVALLEALHDVVAEDGQVLLASEPIDYMEVPWGPRTDGMSLWSMRRHGWLELGFDPLYFADLVARTGWSDTHRVAGPGAPDAHCHLLAATRTRRPPAAPRTATPPPRR